MKPLCFVIMPFNRKKDAEGNEIDFNAIYDTLIVPAIEAAGMQAIRADEETVDGIIHKPMYERLILCDYAVADLTTSNANVLYELGIRHAVKPHTTINIYANGSPLPFDVNSVRCMPYSYDKKKGLTKPKEDMESLTGKLKTAKKRKDTDSPIYQLVDGISFQNSVAHQKTDIFRDQVEYNVEMKKKLKKIRSNKKYSTAQILEELDKIEIDPENEEAGVLIDFMISYRSLGAYPRMIAFIENMPSHVKNTVMVQEQLGFAYNRTGEKEEAIRVLEGVLKQNGPSSETYGILGRVYKDLYDAAIIDQNIAKAKGYLDKAIETYQKGMEADWRDAYPGTNLLTLLYVKGDFEKIQSLACVVEYAVQRKLAKSEDYWDYATLVEIALVTGNERKALENFEKAIVCDKDLWMLETTVNTLDRMLKVAQKRKEKATLIKKVLKLFNEQIKKW
ncbi:TRAFs-binding domain-containing protein [Chitinophaga silvisoli]|uniref:DUF4071 domain-containing protein n=1 Tax=Chitinophaga silvisoli TaxID=2291814 RepID=A0A3E1NX87_9BACT|nr:TRAFs-binding domain-containing protein [Chitinophaga silvisoli]RFM32547.1 DUF4071 domain-containing protein [Chitinophaga silvisoli]